MIKEYLENLKKENGSVFFDGTEYFLEEDAHLSLLGDSYEAIALTEKIIKANGETPEDFDPMFDKHFIVCWEITDLNTDDHSNSCDWENPIKVTERG